MQERHRNPELNPGEQAITTGRYVLPFISAVRPVESAWSVIEIGCGEGGNLAPFLDLGCACVGLDLDATKLDVAARFFASHPRRSELELVRADGHAPPTTRRFDLVLIRDAIEHLDAPDRFLRQLRQLLQPDGVVFVGFPPWRNPFGGHQHHLESRVLSNAPYWHLLPRTVCETLLSVFGESPAARAAFLATKATGISIARFEDCVRSAGLVVARREHFLINPNFEIKFGLKPRSQLPGIRSVPWLRDFLTTTAYYVLRAANA